MKTVDDSFASESTGAATGAANNPKVSTRALPDVGEVATFTAIATIAPGTMCGTALAYGGWQPIQVPGAGRAATGTFPAGTVVTVNGIPHELLQPTPYYTATTP